MDILITGIAGFIGSSTAKELLKKDHKIIGIDNFNGYYNPEFKEENIKGLNIKLYRADIRDIGKLRGIFQQNRIEKIVHLAAMVGVRPSIQNPFVYDDVNVRGTLNLLELARKFNCDKFIFSSSSSVYGNSKVPFSESSSLSPISPYGATKASAEILCKTYSALYKLPSVCLRLFTVYGPNGRPDMAVYRFTEKIYHEEEIEIYGDGTSKRDYTFITDIVDGIIKSLELNCDFKIINLGNSNPVGLKALISLIENNLNKKAKAVRKNEVQGDMKQTYADIRLAKSLLNYSPKIKIEDGIKLFCDWYINNRANQ